MQDSLHQRDVMPGDHRLSRTMGVLYSFQSGGSERLGADLAYRLASRGKDIGVCAYSAGPGPVSDWLRSRGVSTFRDLERQESTWKRLIDLYQLFRRERIHTIHVQHLSVLVVCYLPALLAGVKRIVVTEHTDNLFPGQERLRRRLKWVTRKADVVVAIHEALARTLIDEFDAPPMNVKTIHNGVDTSLFRPLVGRKTLPRELRLESDSWLVGTVGRLHPDKDYSTLLRAYTIARSSSEFPSPSYLILVGDGPERERLENLAKELGVSSNVIFLGDRADVQDIMPQLDTFVMSSITEGVPMALLEAMACGVPVVTTLVGGIPEVIDRVGGIGIQPCQPTVLSRAILDAAPNKWGSDAARLRAIENVREFYGVERMVDEYMKVLEI